MGYEDGQESKFFTIRETIKRKLGVTKIPSLIVYSLPDLMMLTNQGTEDLFKNGRQALSLWQKKYLDNHKVMKYNSEKRLAEKMIRRHCSKILFEVSEKNKTKSKHGPLKRLPSQAEIVEPLEKVYDRDLEAENEAEVEMIRYEEAKWAKDAQIERWIESRDENDDLEVMKWMPSQLPITVIAEKDANDEDSSLNTETEYDETE